MPRGSMPGRFEGLIVAQIRDSILTEHNIRDLVRLVDEELAGVAQEQRRKLAGLEMEVAEVRRRLDRVWQVIETSDLDLADATARIKAHRARQERLERAAAETRAQLSERRAMLDDVEAITACAQDMRTYLQTSDRTESKAFIRSFVKEIAVAPGAATIRYAIPLPEDRRLPDGDTAAEARRGPVPSTVHVGGPDWTKSRTGTPSLVTPSAGIGTVYVSVAAPSTTSIPCTKLRSRRLALRECPPLQQRPEVRHIPLDLRGAGQLHLPLRQLVLGRLPRRRQLILPVPQRQDARRQRRQRQRTGLPAPRRAAPAGC